MANIPISKINKEANSINNNDLLIISQPDSSVENGYVSAKVKWSTVKNNIDVNNIEYLSQSEYDSKKAAGLLDPSKYYATPVDKAVNPIIDYTTEKTATLSWDSTDKKTYVKNSDPKVYYTAERNEIVYTSGSLNNHTQTEVAEAYIIPKDDSLPIKFFTLRGYSDDTARLDTTIILNEGDQLYFSTDVFTSEATTDVDILSYELNGIGSGSGYRVGGGVSGVIDGTLYTLSNGDTKKLVYRDDFTSSPYIYEYIVENDCLFYTQFSIDAGSSNETTIIKLNDEVLDYFTEKYYNDGQDSFALTLPIKSGTKVTYEFGDKPYNGNSGYKSAIVIKEYKLSSLNPQVAFPDWSGNGTTINSGDTITQNGWIIIYYDISSTLDSLTIIKVNNIEVSRAHGSNVGDYQTSVIPVSKGDEITIDYTTSTSIPAVITFYPAKVVVQDANSVIELLYPVGSIYFDGNNSNVCPLEAVINGSTWEAVGTKLLTDGSTAPVVGNGKALGLTDGINNVGIASGSSQVAAIGAGKNGLYGENVGSNYANVDTALVKSLGVPTSEQLGNDLSNSGLITDLSSATGLSVKIWKRIS